MLRTLPPGRQPARRRRRARQGEAAVAEVLGSSMLIGIAVLAAVGFSIILFNLPPPSPGVTSTLEAFILPSSPDRLVVEHRGGTSIPLGLMTASVALDGTVVRANVAERLGAGDPAWSVVAAGGSAKASSANFAPGDQLRYTDAGVRGKTVTVAIVHEGKGRLDLGPLRVQESDLLRPAPTSARTTSPTTIELTFNEALFSVAPSDFTVTNPAVAVTAARLLGDGTRVELVTASFGPAATPTINAIASPLGTADLAGNPLLGGASIVAADGTAPSITTGPTAVPTVTTATITWTTDEAGDSRVEFGPTPALGRTVSDTTLGPGHAIGLTGLSPGTLYYYRASSADAPGNRGTSGLQTFTTVAPPIGNNPTFAGIAGNIIYVSSQERNVGAKLGYNLINPTTSPIQVDLLRFTASPTLGSGASSKFFRGALTTGPGSDAEFSCTWSGTNSDVATCDPAGTFTVPAKGMKQVVLQFTTANEVSEGYTILTADAVVTSPTALTVTAAHNVRHQPSGLHFDLLALSGPAGNPTAGHAPTSGGSPRDFHYRWVDVANNAKIRTRFIIPAGWSDLSVPAQSSLVDLAVNVRQPTATSQGYVDVAQDLSAGSRDFFFRVTPPAGADVLVMQVDFEGSKEGSSKLMFDSLLWFGVTLT